jgi:hypothetical protein
VDDAAASGSAPVAGGGEARLSFGKGRWGGVVTAGVLTPSSARFLSIDVREQRFPLSAAASAAAMVSQHVELSADLGLAAAAVSVRGANLTPSDGSTHLAVGGRAAVALRFPLGRGRVSGLLGAHAEYFPRRYLLDVAPIGSIGSLPRFWLGASAGLLFDLLRAD